MSNKKIPLSYAMLKDAEANDIIPKESSKQLWSHIVTEQQAHKKEGFSFFFLAEWIAFSLFLIALTKAYDYLSSDQEITSWNLIGLGSLLFCFFWGWFELISRFKKAKFLPALFLFAALLHASLLVFGLQELMGFWKEGVESNSFENLTFTQTDHPLDTLVFYVSLFCISILTFLRSKKALLSFALVFCFWCLLLSIGSFGTTSMIKNTDPDTLLFWSYFISGILLLGLTYFLELKKFPYPILSFKTHFLSGYVIGGISILIATESNWDTQHTLFWHSIFFKLFICFLMLFLSWFLKRKSLAGITIFILIGLGIFWDAQYSTIQTFFYLMFAGGFFGILGIVIYRFGKNTQSPAWLEKIRPQNINT